MKLTADLITNAPSYLNPLGEREVMLRGHQIPIIENLGSTKDLYDSVDLTDNDIRVLGNLPKLRRLKTLLIARNRITHIQQTLSHSIPCIERISLEHNSLATLASVAPALSTMSKTLTHLTLAHNPVTQVESYRLFIIWLCPSVRILDYERVKDKEREEAAKMFGTSHDAPTPLATEILGGQQQSLGNASNGEKTDLARLLTDEEKEKLRQQLKTAPSLAALEKIERQLKSGYIE